ncbi:unnamed protein product [Orchesella dallaii]|uniref:Endonuclease/exonuclease/phosphatase domain-containing protein n=1 Tax=Orchesella dallaii TaxID=48710 RepID=A0ABP1S1B8_9HEXA
MTRGKSGTSVSCNQEVKTSHKSTTCTMCLALFHTAIARKCVPGDDREKWKSNWSCSSCLNVAVTTSQTTLITSEDIPSGESDDHSSLKLINESFFEVEDNENDCDQTNSSTTSLYIQRLPKQQSKLNSIRDPINQFGIPGFNCLRKDRSGTEGGGLLVYIHNRYAYEQLDVPFQLLDVECLIVKIITEHLIPILVCTIYLPPSKVCNSSFEIIEEIFSFLRSQKIEFIVQGDLNVDLLKKTMSH